VAQMDKSATFYWILRDESAMYLPETFEKIRHWLTRHPDELADKTYETARWVAEPGTIKGHVHIVSATRELVFGDVPAHVAERILNARNRFVTEITRAIAEG